MFRCPELGGRGVWIVFIVKYENIGIRGSLRMEKLII